MRILTSIGLAVVTLAVANLARAEDPESKPPTCVRLNTIQLTCVENFEAASKQLGDNSSANRFGQLVSRAKAHNDGLVAAVKQYGYATIESGCQDAFKKITSDLRDDASVIASKGGNVAKCQEALNASK